MAQDPAFLFMYKDWLTSMAGWDADVRGWYINLLCHQADKPEGLVNDMETLAELAGVKISQYPRFTECWKHTLVAMFEINDKGKLQNRTQAERLDARRNYKNKQEKRGIVGAFIKKNRPKYSFEEVEWKRLSQELVTAILDTEDKEEIDSILKHTLEAYALSIYGNANGNAIVVIKGDKRGVGKKEGEPEKPKTIYGQCVELYFNFFKSRHQNEPPKFDKKHGAALNSIIEHLRKSVIGKNANLSPPDAEIEAVKSFKLILDSWDSYSDFSKQQVDLCSMNSQFNRIISDLKSSHKNGTSKQPHSKSNSKDAGAEQALDRAKAAFAALNGGTNDN